MPTTKVSLKGLQRVLSLSVVLAVAFSLLVPATAPAVRKIGISTPTFEFNVAPGQGGQGELWVVNDGNEPFNVMVYSANQVVSEQGVISYEVPKHGASALKEPAAWLRIQMPEDSKAFGNVPYVEMDPKERVLVKFSFEVPQGVPPGDHQLMLFFEMFDFATEGGMTSKLTGRVASRMRIRVQGKYEEKMDIRPFAVRGLVIGDLLPYSFTLRNDGNLDEPIEGKIEVIDSSEDVKLSSVVTSETVLYARTTRPRSGVLPLKGVGMGKYTVRLTVTHPAPPGAEDADELRELVKERSVWVVPLWLALALALLVLAVVGRLVWGMAVKAAGRKAAKAQPEPAPSSG